MYQQGVGEDEQVDERKSVARGEAGAHHHLEGEAVVATRAVQPVRQTFGGETETNNTCTLIQEAPPPINIW